MLSLGGPTLKQAMIAIAINPGYKYIKECFWLVEMRQKYSITNEPLVNKSLGSCRACIYKKKKQLALKTQLKLTNCQPNAYKDIYGI